MVVVFGSWILQRIQNVAVTYNLYINYYHPYISNKAKKCSQIPFEFETRKAHSQQLLSKIKSSFIEV